MAVILLIAALVLGGCFFIGAGIVSGVSESIVENEQRKKEIAGKMELEGFTWKSSAYGAALASFTVKNNNAFDVKDVELSFDHLGASGTIIRKSTKTVYEVVGAGNEVEFTDIDMGYVGGSVRKIELSITGGTETFR